MERERVNAYTVVFQPALEGGFVATVPVLPGCMSQGETLDEARREIKDAIRTYLSVLREDGDNIPQESVDQIVERVIAPDPV